MFWTKKEKKKKVYKTIFHEWADSLLFAVVVATLVRFFTFEAYTIPTPSMESSLMVGDFLFVSKLHYGARTPVTPLQVPLTHQTIWGTDIPSFLKWIKLPSYRLPGFSDVKRGDCVVFNFPYDDHLNYLQDKKTTDDKYPTDLKTFYVKRCVAIPGDVLEIKDTQLFINGSSVENPAKFQLEYFIETDEFLNDEYFENLNIYNDFQSVNYQAVTDTSNQTTTKGYFVRTYPENIETIKKLPSVKGVRMYKNPKGVPQPEGSNFVSLQWNIDNFGALEVPKKGQTIPLTSENIIKYGSVIERYEGNKNVEISADKIVIDGQKATTYTFKQNYYFMMGDNRHNSLDSRFWGFVPFDHIVGKPVFIWWSKRPVEGGAGFFKGVRWSRLFSLVK